MAFLERNWTTGVQHYLIRRDSFHRRRRKYLEYALLATRTHGEDPGVVCTLVLHEQILEEEQCFYYSKNRMVCRVFTSARLAHRMCGVDTRIHSAVYRYNKLHHPTLPIFFTSKKDSTNACHTFGPWLLGALASTHISGRWTGAGYLDISAAIRRRGRRYWSTN